MVHLLDLVYISLLLLACGTDFFGSASLTTSFTWRGNILRLKGISVTNAKEAPFKMPSAEPLDYYKEDIVDVGTSGKYPLLPEAKPAYPGNRQLVFSNEMKFRELMSDCMSIYSNELVRCYVDETGSIERAGLLCRIVDSRLLKSGQAMYIIEGMELIQVDGIVVKPGKSYLSSTSTRSMEEEFTDEEIAANEELSNTLYLETKKYVRFLRFFLSQEFTKAGKGLESLRDLCLTPYMISNRPGQLDYASISQDEKRDRHKKFSYACGNLIKGSHEDTQNLLVSSTSVRLAALIGKMKPFATECERLVTEFSANNPSEDIDAGIARIKSLQEDDDISDIAPSPEWTDAGFSQYDLEDEEESFIMSTETDGDTMQ